MKNRRPRAFMLVLAGLLFLGGCSSGAASVQFQERRTRAVRAPVIEGIPYAPQRTDWSRASWEGLPDYAKGYAENIFEYAEESDDLEYGLIYLDEDDIPELVLGMTGYWVSVFTYSSGELYTLIDRWGYGAMGNHGYEYIPKGNVIRNYNGDLGGAIMYEWYGRVSGEHEIESYYAESLSNWMFKDTNHNDKMDEDEPFYEPRYFYYGETEITEAEYDAYRIQGDYEYVMGSQSAAGLLAELQAFSCR